MGTTVSLFVVTAWLAVVPRAAQPAEPTGQAQVRLIAPIEFLPANGEISYVVDQGGLGRVCPLKGAGYFVAPLQLEQGTTINGVTAYLGDTTKVSLGMMSLIRRRPGTFEILATTPVSTGTGAVESLSAEMVTAPVVDSEWSYVLQVVLSGPGVCLHGARVTYKVP